MRKEVITCDQCRKEHDAQYCLPNEWIRTVRLEHPYQLEVERHFCSLACLFDWTADEMMKKGEQR